jgi:propionyl-CoA carboxylase alpha subunit
VSVDEAPPRRSLRGHFFYGRAGAAGETLAVVEAMKMENVLRAERDGVVKSIRAKPGDSLAVDAVIMEFA